MQTNMTSACLFTDNEKIVQAADEFPIRLKVHAEASHRHTEYSQNAESDAQLISFASHQILHNGRFSLQIFLFIQKWSC